MYKYETFAEAYYHTINDVMKKPDYITAPREMKIKEKVNYSFCIVDTLSNTFESPEFVYPKKYLAAELSWYLSGREDLDFISKYSKFWNNIANSDGTINSAYGYLAFIEKNIFGSTEFEWALNSLKKDKDSRQAIMRFNKPRFSYEGVKDFICTMFIQYMIRDDKLHSFVTMRSNDCNFGLKYDVPAFSVFQQYMYLSLKKTYPELELGSYYHNAMSMHIYEKDFEKFDKVLENGVSSSSLPAMQKLPKFQNNGKIIVNDSFSRWISDKLSE